MAAGGMGMPFLETNRVKEREALLRAWNSGMYSKSELAGRFSVTRPTVDLWIERQQDGESMNDRSRAPHHSPRKTAEWLAERMVAERERHPSWGAKKIGDLLRRREPGVPWPADSTIGEVLNRAGLVVKRQGRRRANKGVAPQPVPLAEPGYAETADYKGQFRAGDGSYIYPLTVVDPVSRYIYAIVALAQPNAESTIRAMAQLFRTYGMPHVLVTDNGTPFSFPQALAGLSRFGVWCARYGVDLRHTRAGHPQDNGRHERMHKTLKAETARPPAANLRLQQKRFDEFRREFNEERSHEGIGRQTPLSVHRFPLREFPRREPTVTYPGHYEVRRVGNDGTITYGGRRLRLSESLCREVVGLEEVDDGIWSIYFAKKLLGRLNERDGIIE